MPASLRFASVATMAALSVLLLRAAPLQVSPIAAQRTTGRITGHVTRLDTGANVSSAVVQLDPVTDTGTSRVETDAAGQFEFTGVPVGQYRLTVIAPGLMSPDATAMMPLGPGKLIKLSEGQAFLQADLVVAPMNAIEGRVLDPTGVPVAGVRVEIVERLFAGGNAVLFTGRFSAAATKTNAEGRYRMGGMLPGEYYVRATALPVSAADPIVPVKPSDPHLGYAVTYFPGVEMTSDARPIRLEAGRDAFDVTFSLVAKPVVRVFGRVTDLGGAAVAGAQLKLFQTEAGELRSNSVMMAASDDQGAFSFPTIVAGYYVLQAGAAVGFGSMPVTVAATEDVSGITVMLRPPIRARGHLRFEGGAPPAVQFVDVMFVPTNFLTGPAGSVRSTSVLKDDWSFTTGPLASIGLLRVIAPDDWRLKSVMLDGHDIADMPHDFQSADVNGLEIVMTKRLATITGTVTDGVKPAMAAIAIFADDSTKWLLLLSRFTTVVTSSATGEFNATGLLAGQYRVIALETVTLLTPDTLATLKPRATLVTVPEGGSATVSLRIAKR